MKPLHQVKRLLKKYEMEEIFDCIEGAELDGSKTKTMMIESICSAYKEITKGNVFMVGDTFGDYNVADEAGCNFVGALYGYGFEKDGEHDFKTIRKLDELVEVIDRFN